MSAHRQPLYLLAAMLLAGLLLLAERCAPDDLPAMTTATGGWA